MVPWLRRSSVTAEAEIDRDQQEADARQEPVLPDTAAPIAGVSSTHRNIALAAMDIRNEYKFYRRIDHKSMLERGHYSVRRVIGDTSITDLCRQTIKTGLSMIPVANMVPPLYEAYCTHSQIKLLKQTSQKYSEELKPVFKRQLNRSETERNMQLIEMVDISPLEGLSKIASLAKLSQDLADSEQARLLRMQISELRQQLDQPKPNDLHYRDWHKQQVELANQRNQLLCRLLSSDADAAERLLRLLENTDLSQHRNPQDELNHHCAQIHQKHSDDTSLLRPSRIRQQVLSEAAMNALKRSS